MPRLCFAAALACACAPATGTLAPVTPAVAKQSAAAAPLVREAPHRRRVARLAPPFAASPGTRRVEDTGASPELELAAAR